MDGEVSGKSPADKVGDGLSETKEVEEDQRNSTGHQQCFGSYCSALTKRRGRGLRRPWEPLSWPRGLGEQGTCSTGISANVECLSGGLTHLSVESIDLSVEELVGLLGVRVVQEIVLDLLRLGRHGDGSDSVSFHYLAWGEV